MTRRPIVVVLVVLTGVSSALLAIVTNFATTLLPPGWQLAPSRVWLTVALLAGTSAALGVWQFSLHSSDGSDLPVADPAELLNVKPEKRPRTKKGRVYRKLSGIIPAQLPPDISGFIGREKELEELRRQLEPIRDRNQGSRTAVISSIGGKPGIGKSALAIHLAHQLVDEFPDGQLYADLHGGRPDRLTAPQVLSQFLRTLGVSDEKALMDFDEQVARYRTLLAGRQILVVLDNAADAVQVRPLLPGSPTCATLITSRGALHSLQESAPLILDVLDADTAVQLLGKLAGPDRITAESQAAREIAGYCGNLPGALRIAGAKLAARPNLPLATLARGLADERRRLGELGAGDLEIRTSFTLSYQDLRPTDARVFRLLGLLDGPDVGPGVVAAMADATVEESQKSLDNLVDAQLLEAPTPDRYRLHDLLRLFAKECAQGQESEETRRSALARAIDWYHTTLEVANERLGPKYRWRTDSTVQFLNYTSALAWLEAERPNLVAAVRQASRNEWDSLTCQLSQNLFDFFNLRKYWLDWQDISSLGLQAAQRSGDLGAQARMLHNYGYVLRDRRSYEEAIALIEESIAIFRNLGDRLWEGRALGTLGTAYRAQRRFHQAIFRYEQSLAIRREVGDRLGEGQVLQALGTTYHQEGRFEKAIEELLKSLVIFRELGDRRGESRTLGLLGNTYLQQRRSSEAVHFLKQSLTISCETGARYVESRALTDLGRLHADEHRYTEAIDCLQQSLAIFRTIGDRYAEAQTLRNLAIVVEASKNRKIARNYWEKGLVILDDLDPDEAKKIRTWLEQPDQPRSSWSEWGIW